MNESHAFPAEVQPVRPRVRKWKRVGCVSILVLVSFATTALILNSRRSSPFSDSLGFLRGVEPVHSERMIGEGGWVYSTGSSAVVGIQDLKLVVDTFTLPESFKTVNERAKKELKPRALSASAFPTKNPTTTLYTVKDAKSGTMVSVTLQESGPGKTTVTIQEFRDATWVDRSLNWLRGLFESKEPNGQESVFPIR